jgi:hypothetical protein
MLLISTAAAEPPNLPLPWLKLDSVYVTPGPARMYTNNAIHVLTRMQPGDALGPQDQGVWHTADLTPFGVSEDAKAAFLSGILIITHGLANEIAWMTVVFRRPGDQTDCSKYIGQVAETSASGGQRSGLATLVPLKDGKVEYCYRIPPNMPSWPDASAYGINLSVQWWGR